MRRLLITSPILVLTAAVGLAAQAGATAASPYRGVPGTIVNTPANNYAGYPERPEAQATRFIGHPVTLKKARIAAGEADFGEDPSTWGNWIADVERPAARYRGRYQPRLQDARALLGRKT